MTLQFIKWVIYKMVITLFLVSITSSSPTPAIDETNLLKIVKRNLLAKEREYLKSKPMSEDLRDFIKRLKKRSKFKRELDQKHLYVVKDGSIVPLSNVKTRDADLSFDNPESEPVAGKYTVIPLIIPYQSNVLASCDTESTTKKITKSATKETRNIDTKETTHASSRTTTPEENEGEATDDFFDKSSDSTTKTGTLLSNVIKELMQFENEAKPSPETLLCNVNGDWDSYAGGVQIRIFLKDSPIHPRVRVLPREPPMEGFMSSNSWNVSALVPFKQASLIAITAVSTKGKKIATFIGECRVCEGVETISGNWLMQRRSKGCKDREVAHTIISDVFRRNNIRKLQHDHLVEISASSSEGYDI